MLSCRYILRYDKRSRTKQITRIYNTIDIKRLKIYDNIPDPILHHLQSLSSNTLAAAMDILVLDYSDQWYISRDTCI